MVSFFVDYVWMRRAIAYTLLKAEGLVVIMCTWHPQALFNSILLFRTHIQCRSRCLYFVSESFRFDIMVMNIPDDIPDEHLHEIELDRKGIVENGNEG